MSQSDKYIIDLRVEQGKGLTEMEAMVKRMQALRQQRTQLNKALKDGLVTENQHAKALNRIQVELKGLSGRYREASNAASGLTREGIRFRDKIAGAMTNSLMKLGAAMAGAFAISRIQQFVSQAIRLNAQLSDSLADVQKTTGLTADEVVKLDKELGKLDTRTARSELLALATVAGRVNIEGAENIQKFVEDSNQIQVALGDILGEDSALTIARIAASYRESILGIGSSINELGNTTRAQENDIVDFMSRLQGSAINLRISSSDIAAYGATFSAFGVQMESTGTAMSKILQLFVLETGRFEEAAGLASGSLTELIGREGVNEGFLGFVSALREANPEAKDFLQRMKDLGIEDRRTGEAFQLLANNLDEYRRAQDVANTATQEATSITEEYEIRNNTLAASLDKLNNAYERLITSGDRGGVLQNTTDSLTTLLRWILPAEEGIRDLEQAEASYIRNHGGMALGINQTIAGIDILLDRMHNQGIAAKDLVTEIAKLTDEQQRLHDLEDSEDWFSAKDRIELLRVTKELTEAEERLSLVRSGDFSAISQEPIQPIGTPSRSRSSSGGDDPVGESIIQSIRDRIKLLQEQRDLVTDTTGGEAEIKRLTVEIAKEQQKLNDLLGKGAKTTKEVEKSTDTIKKNAEDIKEEIGEWTEGAIEFIDWLEKIEQAQTGRFAPEGSGRQRQDDFVSGLVDDSMTVGEDQFEGDWSVELYRQAKEAYAEFLEGKVILTQEAQDRINAIIQEGHEFEKSLQLQAIQAFDQAANTLVQNAQERANRRLQIELDLLAKMRQANEISAEEYERLQEESRKRQFEQLKKQRIAEAGISLATAILNILATEGGLNPKSALTIAATTGMHALQVAAIQAAQYKRGGMLQGDSHAKGGIPVSIGGKRIVEAEGGEAIINKRSTAMFRDQLSAINQAGGGVKFAQGGLTSAPRATVGMGVPSQGIDYDRMAGAMARINIETNIVEISNAQALQNKITEIRRL